MSETEQRHPDPEDEERGENPSDRFRRLTGDSPEEPDEERPEERSEEGEAAPRDISDSMQMRRHPTGLPDLTGGWFGLPSHPDAPPLGRAPETSRDGRSPVAREEDPARESPATPGPESPPRGGEAQEHEPPPAAQEPPSKEAGEQEGRIHTPTPPPPMLGDTPSKTPPAVDASGMPLPRRVDEIDADATRVSPRAYEASDGGETIPPGPPAPEKPPRPRPRRDWRRPLGCLIRMIVLGLFVLVVVALAAGSFALYEYYQIAATLPSVDDLRQRASQFETTRILDRNGNVLYEILDPTAGRRTYVTLDRISPYVVAATLATEDKDFYSNPGFDPLAIARAFWQNYQSGETVSGASTITQQLARTLLFTPDERAERSYMRKVREALLANEVNRRYTKDEILELYLNEVYYGNLAYGIEAAAQTYFGTSADRLTLPQAAFLAGLPQAPSVYDVYTNRDVTMHRFQQVLVLMFEASQEQGCIYVSNNFQPVCVSAVDAADAYGTLQNYEFNTPDVQIRYPHWVNYVRAQLESQFDSQTIYRSGFTVYTTLDPGLQETAQEIVRQQVQALADRRVSNGALVAIRPATGEILAMVGSADFYNEAIDGQVNMALAPRQPGSAIKPLTYTAAFEQGWTPGTLIWDVPSEFPPSGEPDDPRPPYRPVNYDERFHGPVTVRGALANSYNVPAVKTLDFVGVYDDPVTPEEDGLVPMARRMGITTLTREDYGLSLTLGGGEVPLLELTQAYATYANGGRLVPAFAITRILDKGGEVVYDYQPPPGEQVIRPEHSFLITSILSDNEARTPAFGRNSVLNLPFTVAAKTGTTNDFRDNWTMGYTPDLAVGVWVGNADFSPMQGTSGLTGAAPIWATFMQEAIQRLTGGNPTPFVRPAGVIERVICAVSGTEPSRWCPNQRGEFFAADQPPLPSSEDLWQQVIVDTWTGLRTSTACSDFTDEVLALDVEDPWAIEWLHDTEQGEQWAAEMGFSTPVVIVPERECTAADPRPQLSFSGPREGATVNENPIEIFGQVDATNGFQRFRLEYGVGPDPVQWETLTRGETPINPTDRIYTWDVSEVPEGPLTLRLYLRGDEGAYAETRLHFDMQLPTPTPTPTATPTLTPTPTPTPTVTPTPTTTPTNTPQPTLVFTLPPPPTQSP